MFQKYFEKKTTKKGVQKCSVLEKLDSIHYGHRNENCFKSNNVEQVGITKLALGTTSMVTQITVVEATSESEEIYNVSRVGGNRGNYQFLPYKV